jgi:hypothetical protein
VPPSHKNIFISRREPIMSNSESVLPEKGDSENPIIWLGKLVLTVVAGILLAKFGVRVSDNLKL